MLKTVVDWLFPKNEPKEPVKKVAKAPAKKAVAKKATKKAPAKTSINKKSKK